MSLSPRNRRKLERLLVEARWRRLASDAEAFFAEAVQIPAPGTATGRAPFALFDYQRDTLDTFDANRFVVVLKARQLGLTTLAAAYALHQLLFMPGSTILLVSENQRVANKALDILDFMWRFLPEWVQQRAPKLEVDSATEHVWRFEDGLTSRIVSLPATKTAGASETATLVLWDEAALAADQEETYKTLKPTTDRGGNMIVFSTARGSHNRFARLYREAERGENEFVRVFHPWYRSRFINRLADELLLCEKNPCDRCVDRTQYDAKRREFADNPWEFFSEYPETAEEAFRESGRSRFADLPPIEEFSELGWRGRLDGSVMVADPHGPLRVNPEYLTGVPSWAKTVVSCDPSGGVGGDFTAATVGFMDRDGVPHRIAFWHDNQTEPVDGSKAMFDLGMFFAGGSQQAAQIAVEKAGGYGDTYINELQRNRYPNLYLHRKTGHRQRKSDVIFGFPMVASRRPLVIDKLAQWVPSTSQEKPFTLQGIDQLLRHELGAFVVTDKGRYEADTGMHDDLVMSAGIWLFVLDEIGPPTVTPGTRGEASVRRVTVDVSHIMRDAEKARRSVERGGRGEGRSQHRELRS